MLVVLDPVYDEKVATSPGSICSWVAAPNNVTSLGFVSMNMAELVGLLIKWDLTL